MDKYDDLDRNAFQALAAGVASAGQQKRALQFIFSVSGIRELPTYSDNPLELAYNNGRKSVGWHVARMIELVGVTTDPAKPKETK